MLITRCSKASNYFTSGILSKLKASHHAGPMFGRSVNMMSSYNCEALKVETISDFVISVQLNRPEKRNAISKVMWQEIGDTFRKLGSDPDCRSIVLTGDEKIFTSGIDMGEFVAMAQVVMSDADVARKCFELKKTIKLYQDLFSELEKCPKPIICAINGPCVGGGVDLIAGTDVRYCTADAWFQVKEVDVGLAADVGTLQRLPRILGSQSLIYDLCLSCRKMGSSEALSSGLVSRVFPDRATMLEAAIDWAKLVASSSPLAVQTTKMALVYSRDHSVQEGLDYLANLNMTFLQSEDVRLAAMSQLERSKEKPTFAKL